MNFAEMPTQTIRELYEQRLITGDHLLAALESRDNALAILHDQLKERQTYTSEAGGAHANEQPAELYDFEMHYVYARSDPYYDVRWDRAKPATIRATNVDEAYSKLQKVLAKPGDDECIMSKVKSIHAIETN